MKLLNLMFCHLCLLVALSWPPAAAAQTATVQNAATERPLTAQESQQAVQTIAQLVAANYLFADKAEAAAELLRSKAAAGDFNRQTDAALLNLQISALLAKATQDTGFELVPLTSGAPLATGQPLADTGQHQHDAFETGMLDPRVGYVRIRGNFDYPGQFQLIDEQFRALASVDALIIDLREADQATLAVAQQMLSYFVEPDTTLARLQFQQQADNIRTVALTKATPFKPALPLYVVNSAFVAGSWEFFGYTLQHLDKAVIVGEETMGLGSLSRTYPVNERLAIRLNHARLTHPLTGHHWDNEGIVPDYFYASRDAFQQAYQLALAGLAAK